MDFIIKHSEEYFPIHADFGTDLISGETVSGYTIACINRDTGVDTKAAIVDWDYPETLGAEMGIKGGTDQEVHIITVLATTSLGNEYRRVIFIYVIDDPAQDSFEKSPDEIAVVAVDFINELEPADTVASVSVVATNNVTGVVSTSTVIASPTVSSPRVYFKVQAGTAMVDYNIKVKATSAGGFKYVRVVTMRVRDI
jgi:hypothetical protein